MSLKAATLYFIVPLLKAKLNTTSFKIYPLQAHTTIPTFLLPHFKVVSKICLDPIELDLPILKKPVFHYQNRADAPSVMVEYEKKIKAADAIVLVSAEYNHSIPPALSNLIDHFGASCYSYKPSGIICYSMGQYGGMRAAMQLRSMLGEIGSLSISYIFGIPKVQKMFDEEGNPLDDYMNTSCQKFITQLDWYANALRNHRESAGVPN